MLERLKRLLFGPPMTLEERKEGIMCIESSMGGKVFHLDGPAAEALIKKSGFPVRQGNGPQRPN
jgi:hypothetical protein